MMMRTDSTHLPDLIKQAEKVLVKYNQKYENDILFYCILNAELNIISLYWNKQHFESSIIKWGCCLLDKNFHLVLMFTCFGIMQFCIGWTLSRLVYTLAQLTRTCLRSRHLHMVERYTHTMVFWTSFPLVPLQFGDLHRRLDRRHKSESLDHRTWWISRWRVL